MRDTDEMQDNRRIYESYRDEFHRRLAEDQSADSKSNVLGSILMSVNLSNKVKSSKLKHYDLSRAYFQEQWRNSFTSDWSVCTTQRRTSKDECSTEKKQIQRSMAPQSHIRLIRQGANWLIQHRLDFAEAATHLARPQ